MTDWHRHLEAVEIAKNSITDLEQNIGYAMQMAEETLGIVANAVGQTESEAGSAAQRFVVQVHTETLPEALRILERAKEELDSYGRGF